MRKHLTDLDFPQVTVAMPPKDLEAESYTFNLTNRLGENCKREAAFWRSRGLPGLAQEAERTYSNLTRSYLN